MENTKEKPSEGVGPVGGNEDNEKSRQYEEQNIVPRKLEVVSMITTEDHEHVFLTDDQDFDEESFTRTKRCRCGFSIQVEEF